MTLLALELRKNVLAAASLGLAFVASLTLGALREESAAAGLGGALTLWRFIAVPLGACLIGGACGAGLSSPHARERESALPVSPLRRLAAAAAAAALLYSLYHMLVFAGMRLSPFHGPFFRPPLSNTASQLLVAVPFLASSFAGAIITANGIAGGLLGLAAGTSALAPIALILASGPESHGSDAAVLLGALGGGSLATASAWLAWRGRERGRHGLRPALILAALLLGPGLIVWLETRTQVIGIVAFLADDDEEERP